MRLAVFTNQFPNKVSTFFARDMRGLIAAGIEVDVFPFYPLDNNLWRYVPDLLNENILPKTSVHHLTLGECFRNARIQSSKKLFRFLADALSIDTSAITFGVEPFAKSSYVMAKAWTWAHQFGGQYDHVLAYWGNYAATCAYVFHRLTDPSIPFSLFLHAGTDLYRKPLYMTQKLLYADNILTCSEFNRRFIKEHFAISFAKKIFVHRHGLDLSEFSFEPNGRSPRKIIAVGRIEKEKGYDYLIKAVAEIRHLDIEVELVGTGSQVDTLKMLAKELGVIGRIKFTGWLTTDEVRRAMRQAAVLVHPSPDLGDGVPNVIKECMALGTPVIASSIAGIPELLDNGSFGTLVPPRSVEALSDAIKDVLAGQEKHKNSTALGRKYAERNFDMWRNGECLSNLLRSTKRQSLDEYVA